MRLPVHWRVVLTLAALMAAGLVVLSIYLIAQGHSGRLIGAIWLWGAAITAGRRGYGLLLDRQDRAFGGVGGRWGAPAG